MALTGFSPTVRRLITNRAGGLCERCTAPGKEIHHRRPRGAGGSRDPITNTAVNGVLLCSGCHRWCESYRNAARDLGWLVRQGHDPTGIPVFWRESQWVLLTSEGSKIEYNPARSA